MGALALEQFKLIALNFECSLLSKKVGCNYILHSIAHSATFWQTVGRRLGSPTASTRATPGSQRTHLVPPVLGWKALSVGAGINGWAGGGSRRRSQSRATGR